MNNKPRFYLMKQFLTPKKRTDLAGRGGVGDASVSSVNFVTFGKNHLLVVSSNKVTPRLYFSYLLISSVAEGGGGGGGAGGGIRGGIFWNVFEANLKGIVVRIFSSLRSQESLSIPLQNVQQFSLVSGFA